MRHGTRGDQVENGRKWQKMAEKVAIDFHVFLVNPIQLTILYNPVHSPDRLDSIIASLLNDPVKHISI